MSEDEAQNWKAAEYDRIEKIVNKHLGFNYWQSVPYGDLSQAIEKRLEKLEKALKDLKYAVEKFGDWAAETRVGMALEQAEEALREGK